MCKCLIIPLKKQSHWPQTFEQQCIVYYKDIKTLIYIDVQHHWKTQNYFCMFCSEYL